MPVGSLIARVAALRFFFVRTLERHESREDLLFATDYQGGMMATCTAALDARHFV
jgi:hypothetical protein